MDWLLTLIVLFLLLFLFCYVILAFAFLFYFATNRKFSYFATGHVTKYSLLHTLPNFTTVENCGDNDISSRILILH